jgi:hypothetical protein
MEKSLIISSYYELALNASKPVIFVVISVLVVALVYSSISAFNVFALVPDEAPPNAECVSFGGNLVTYRCCWTETDPDDPEGIELYYCHICPPSGRCGEKFPASSAPTPPVFDPTAPLQVGVLEQPEQPLFGGQNDAGVPPTGGIEQTKTILGVCIISKITISSCA